MKNHLPQVYRMKMEGCFFFAKGRIIDIPLADGIVFHVHVIEVSDIRDFSQT